MLFDAHADILTDMYLQYKKTGTYDSFRRRHLEKYKKADVKASVFVNFTDPYYDNSQVFDEIFDVAFHELDQSKDILTICKNSHDIEQASKDGLIGVLVGAEGLHFLKDLNYLRELYDKGLRHAILTWNETNQYGSGVSDLRNGLTEEGLNLIREMEKLGIIIDLAHSNKQTFFDVLNNVTKPVFLSHGNCRALCDHIRNYTDEQLLKLKENGGVLGITAVAPFLSRSRAEFNVKKMAEHIDYAVKLIGIDHVGLGLDVCFYLNDGLTSTNVQGMEDIDQINNLYECLKDLGYSKEDIEKISYKNFMNVVKTVLG